MEFPSKYKCLKTNEFSSGEFTIVPLRYNDRSNIMSWRNEQMYHLRQSEELTKEKQEDYFQNNVAILFQQSEPSQLLFSFLKNNECIGYGGLVHINWIDKNSELSFIMKTALEQRDFKENWDGFLTLIQKVAFQEVKLHKIHTFAFDLRPHLYQVFEDNGFDKEAVLKEHCLYKEKYIDVVIHSKINDYGY